MFIAGLITASRVVRGIADSLPDYPSGDTVNFDSVIRMLALKKYGSCSAAIIDI